MKKILALVLCMLMMLAFVACGENKTADGDANATTAATTTADVKESTEESEDTSAPEDTTPAPEAKKTFVVAMECGYAPYNWTQDTDANGAVKINDSDMYAYGYDVIIAKKIAEANDWDLQIVKLDWDSLIPALQAGKVDAVIAGQSITAERQAQVDFSNPYYYATIVTLVKGDSAYANATSVADLKGATATSQRGTIWYDICLDQIPEVNKLAAQDTAPAMLVALEAGTCDVVVTDAPTGNAALTAYPNFKLLDFYGTDGDYEVSDEEVFIGISVKKGNTELLDAINTVLAEMTSDDYTDLMNEAIKVQPLSE